MNYEEDIRIDETALDVEWLEQASLFMRYARNAAEARRALDVSKERLDVIRASLDKEVRSNPEKFGIEKITETAVSNTIISIPAFQGANEGFLNAKFEADLAQAAVNAFNQRKDALENLVKLHGMQWFAGPKVPRNLHEEYQNRRDHSVKTVNARIGQRLSRKNSI
jgi:hypothetical protein